MPQPQPQSQKNVLLFFLIAFFILMTGYQLQVALWPPPPREEQKPEELPSVRLPDARLWGGVPATLVPSPSSGIGQLAAELAVARWAAYTPEKPVAVKPPPEPVVPRGPRPEPIVMGDDTYNLKVTLDPRGAGVRSVILPHFQKADQNGKPVWQDDAHKIPEPMELVQAERNRLEPSYQLFHYDPTQPNEPRPINTLGKIDWKVAEVRKEKREDGVEVVTGVTFTTYVPGTDVVVTKMYNLEPGDYHVRLAVKLTRKAGGGGPLNLRYQLCSAHGLPVEGAWYTNPYFFRNALVGRVDPRGYLWRTLQDSRTIGVKAGGETVEKKDGRSILYAGVSVQYFASVVVVDNDQENRDFLSHATPTLEQMVTRGRIKAYDTSIREVKLVSTTGGDYTFRPEGDAEAALTLGAVRPGDEVGVVWHNDGVRYVAKQFLLGEDSYVINPEDLMVRVTTEPVSLEPGAEVEHRYLLYHGPSKVRLLATLSGTAQVPQPLVDRYHDTLHLNTLTDYQSPTWYGEFASTIYWNDLLFAITNLLHRVLGWLHYVVPHYGLCIILLTMLVRLAMYPISRKQAMNVMRMQKLAPELKKLQEKYKDDRQQLNVAMMELYGRHGVNPLSTCWVAFLQIPILGGLYYCLQESIHFRLAPFLWIDSLGAPDMLFPWTNQIPWISRPQDYGSFLFLGPFFNLLPVISVVVMLYQQIKMTPPALDEQQKQQYEMMKFMTIFIGLMFYKVAAGLCLYFIVSAVWGLTERQLLPKYDPSKTDTGPDKPRKPGLFERVMREARARQQAATEPALGQTAQPQQPAPSQQSQGGQGGRKKRKNRGGGGKKSQGTSLTGASPPANGDSGPPSMLQKVKDWWAEILKQAEKK